MTATKSGHGNSFSAYVRGNISKTLDNPPLRYDLRFEGIETNADGLIAEADLFELFDRSIAVLGELEETYALNDAAYSPVFSASMG